MAQFRLTGNASSNDSRYTCWRISAIYAQSINLDALQLAKQPSELIVIGFLVCKFFLNNIL